MNRRVSPAHAFQVGPWLVVGAAFFGAPLLIYSGAIGYAQRFHALVLVALLLLAYALARGYTWPELGMRLDTLRFSLFWNAILAATLGGLLLLAYRLGALRELPDRPGMIFALFYVFVSCPAQEFACRGFLFAHLKRLGVNGALGQVLITAVCYASIHIIYRDVLTLLLTFAVGTIWGMVYRRYPNLLGVVFSHSVLGLLSIFIGMV